VKVLTVVGARPQFVKAFAVSRALRADHEEVLVHTGQHYDRELSEVFFAELGIPEPDHKLGVGSGSHATQTAGMLSGLEAAIEAERPDVVLTYGDTNSTLAAALATAKLPPPLAHVEAGLRANDMSIPEEVNRVVTDHVSDLLLAPTENAVRNLGREGITEGVVRTGDVMYDALLWARDRAADRTDALADLGLSAGEYVLATVHRERNTDERARLASIVRALEECPREVVFPVHPRTVEALRRFGLHERAEAAVTLTDPVGYRSCQTAGRGRPRRHRLRGRPEGGVLPRHPLHHPPRADGVARDRRGRRQRPRRGRRGGHRRGTDPRAPARPSNRRPPVRRRRRRREGRGGPGVAVIAPTAVGGLSPVADG